MSWTTVVRQGFTRWHAAREPSHPTRGPTTHAASRRPLPRAAARHAPGPSDLAARPGGRSDRAHLPAPPRLPALPGTPRGGVAPARAARRSRHMRHLRGAGPAASLRARAVPRDAALWRSRPCRLRRLRLRPGLGTVRVARPAGVGGLPRSSSPAAGASGGAGRTRCSSAATPSSTPQAPSAGSTAAAPTTGPASARWPRSYAARPRAASSDDD